MDSHELFVNFYFTQNINETKRKEAKQSPLRVERRGHMYDLRLKLQGAFTIIIPLAYYLSTIQYRQTYFLVSI